MTGAVGQDVTIGVAARTLSLNGSLLNSTPNVGLLVDNTNAFKLTIVCDLKLTTVANAVTFINNSANVVTIGATVGGGTTLQLNNEVLTIDGPGNFLVNAQVTSGGPSTIVKNGSGTLTLTGNNNFGTGATINAGTVVANTATSLSNQDVTINAGTMEVAGTYSENRNIILGSANSTIKVDPGFTLTNSGTISGSGSLNKTGGGTLIIGNKTETYTGSTNVSAGILQINKSEPIPNTSDLNVSGTGTFDVQTFTETVRNVTLSSGSITGTGTGTVIASSYAVQSGTASAILAGTGATMTKTTSGTVTLSGANTFTGATTVSGGTLTLAAGGTGALGTTASVTVNAGGTVLLGASNQIKNTAPMTLAGGTFRKRQFQ